MDQHALLVDLESRYRGQVLYLAPTWHSGRQMNAHYATDLILANSLAVNALAIGPLPRGARHVVVYTDDRSDPVYLCSDPRRSTP